MPTAYIGLGSNLEQPRQHVQQALQAFAQFADCQLLCASRLYRSAPVGGPIGQPDYINAVAALSTQLAPEVLLDALQQLEQQHGRVRHERWGPRTLDLDLLLYDDWIFTSARLTVPHPRLHVRAFVLQPLYEIAPELQIPGRGALRHWLSGCADQPIAVLTPA